MTTKSLPATLDTLLAGLVDYAGLFPPAKLDMTAAVDAYAGHRRQPRSSMLGRFVAPAPRLTELAAAFDARGTDDGPWPLSVLTGTDLESARQEIDAFLDAHPAIGRLDAIEMAADDDDAIARGAACFPEAERFVEIPYDRDPSALMRALAAHGSRAKIRTGGVTADAFPSSFELARFLTAAAGAGVAMKATAGLHHPMMGSYPLTYDEGSPCGRMFGFLTVFLAAALAQTGLDDPRALVPLLEERDPDSLVFADDAVRWRDHVVDRDQLASARRAFARSYGSCSFDEPVADLEAIGLL